MLTLGAVLVVGSFFAARELSDADVDVNSGAKVADSKPSQPSNEATRETGAPPTEAHQASAPSLKGMHLSSNDLHAFYEDMLDRSSAGDGEATYRAALSLQECALALSQNNRRMTCGSQSLKDSFPEKRYACEAAAKRCENFASRDIVDLNRERDELFALSVEQGYPRAIAKDLTTWWQEEPDRAEEIAADLLSSTDDFGTLYYVGRYLQDRLYSSGENWIGGTWDDERNAPGAWARWGDSAWVWASCRMTGGCPEQSIYMRNACLRGDGCQAGWGYDEYIRYYRSPYEVSRIETMSNDMFQAMRAGDISRLLGG